MNANLKFQSWRKKSSPFSQVSERRPLKVLVDSTRLKLGEPAEVLRELGFFDDLEVFETHGDGQERVIFGDRHDNILSVRVLTDKGEIGTGVFNVSQWDHFAREPILEDGLILPPGPWTDESYRLRQYLLADVADMLDVDIFVTDDPFLLEFRRSDFLQMNFMSTVNAVSIIGLFLRSRNIFTVKKGSSFSVNLSRGLFYWVLAREMTPAGWRWFSAVVESTSNSGEDLIGLGGSLLTRVAQAIKARDYVHWNLLQGHNNETADDALFFLDFMLVSLSAAFDVVAGVADVALGLNGQSKPISWNNDPWRKAL